MRKNVVVPAAILAALSVAVRTDAQVSPLMPLCPVGRTPVLDTSDVFIGLEPSTSLRSRTATDAKRQRAESDVAAIKRRFVAPEGQGGIPVLADVQPAGARSPARSRMGTNVIVIHGSGGRLQRLAWQYIPMSEPLASALVRAAAAADAAGELADSSATTSAALLDSVTLFVPTSGRAEDIAEPLMQLRIRSYHGDESPHVLRMEQPRYPGEALAGELEARVEAIFVIGSDGRVIPETIRFTRIDRAMFVAPVRSVLLDAEFRPGISGGCAVPTTAQQPFQFLIAP